MHIIIEHMFLMLRKGAHYVHAGTRISCDDGKSWIIDCKRPEGLVFKRDQVVSFSMRRREVDFPEYKQRLLRQLKYGMVME